MDDKSLMLAYATPILAAVVKEVGCSDLDNCVNITITLLNKLKEQL